MQVDLSVNLPTLLTLASILVAVVWRFAGVQGSLDRLADRVADIRADLDAHTKEEEGRFERLDERTRASELDRSSLAQRVSYTAARVDNGEKRIEKLEAGRLSSEAIATVEKKLGVKLQP